MRQGRELFVLFCVSLLLIGGCAPMAPAPGAPTADLKWPPPGSSYVLAERNTGSYGSGTGQVTIRFLGEQTWEGKKVMAFSDGVTTSYVDSQRRLLARVRGGTRLESWEPYFVNADWPIFVGKWWVNRFRYIDHERGRTFDNVQYDGRVEAYEDVATQAGTFKAFRITYGNPFSSLTLWYSPDLGLFIKSRAERFSGHYLGLGTRETELVSYEIKR